MTTLQATLDRPPWLNLRGAFAATGCIAIADAQVPVVFSDYLVWGIAGAMLVVAANSWRLLRKTAARHAETNARIAPLQAQHARALDKIRDFSDSQRRFVGVLAQEISAPLATIVIHADLILASGGEPATVQHHARSLVEDARHLSALVESLLHLAQPLEQEDTSRHVPVHFHDIVVDAVRRCQSLAGARGVTVVPTLAETGNGASVEVLGNAALLGAMIENLLHSAVLSAPRGTRVDLQVKLQGEEVLLCVRDLGAGLDPDHVDSLFEGLFQVPTQPRPSTGTGLSLAIARRVAEHHRGTVALRNVAEGGCEFEVQLPRWRAEGPPEAAGAP